MGLFLKQTEQRSQLQSKIEADLQARLTMQNEQAAKPKPQSTILDGQRQTSPFAWVWIVLVVAAIISAVVVFL